MTPKFEITLAALRKEGACVSGYNKVVRMLQGKGSPPITPTAWHSQSQRMKPTQEI